VVRSLELIRRRCSTDAAEAHVAALIAEWIRLAVGGDADALALLNDPFVEVWATGALRDDLPVADADAIARLLGPRLGAESEFKISIEAANSLVLPRCGGALSWDGSRAVVVRCGAGSMTVTAVNGTATFTGSGRPAVTGSMVWKPIPLTRPTATRHAWTIALDGTDVLSNSVGPGALDELDGDAERRWMNVIDGSWRLLEERHHGYVPAIADFARVLVPQISPDPRKHMSGSSADGFGAIALSLTSDVPTFAVALIHETQHLKLNALLDVVALHDADSEPRYYAGWRDDPRPFQALLHGVYAFSAVTEFWRVEYLAQTDASLRRRYGFEYSLWAAQTTASLRELIEADVATDEGRHFLAGIEDVAAGWNTAVEESIAAAVGDVMAEHWLNWQLSVASYPGTVGCNLRRAWRLALTGVDTDPTGGPVSAVDRALVSDDARRALDLAKRAMRSDPHPGNALRLSRAYAHNDMTEAAESVLIELLESTGASAQPMKAGCP
jgi:HEXXH motif-containing protein